MQWDEQPKYAQCKNSAQLNNAKKNKQTKRRNNNGWNKPTMDAMDSVRTVALHSSSSSEKWMRITGNNILNSIRLCRVQIVSFVCYYCFNVHMCLPVCRIWHDITLRTAIPNNGVHACWAQRLSPNSFTYSAFVDAICMCISIWSNWIWLLAFGGRNEIYWASHLSTHRDELRVSASNQMSAASPIECQMWRSLFVDFFIYVSLMVSSEGRRG